MFTYLKQELNFSDYQIAQLKYFFLTLLSEISKLILMALLFRSQLGNYFYCIIILSALRLSTGGVHCNTYIGCFLTTLGFVWVTLQVTSHIPLATLPVIILLLLCAILNGIIGPISSPNHLPLNPAVKKRSAYQAVVIIILHIILFYNFNNYYLFHIGAWVIILHTLQLIIAYFLKRRRMDESTENCVI